MRKKLMSIKITDNEVTINFTKGDFEGYIGRFALGLLIQDPNSFSPEEAQRVNTLLDTIEIEHPDADNLDAIDVLRNEGEEGGNNANA